MRVTDTHALIVIEDKEAITRVRLMRQRCFLFHDKVLAGSEGQAKGHCHRRPQGEPFGASVHRTRQAIHDACEGVRHRDFLTEAKGDARIVLRSVSRQQHCQSTAAQFTTVEDMLVCDQIVRHMRNILVNRHCLDRMAFGRSRCPQMSGKATRDLTHGGVGWYAAECRGKPVYSRIIQPRTPSSAVSAA